MDPVSAKQYGRSKHKQAKHRDGKYKYRSSNFGQTGERSSTVYDDTSAPPRVAGPQDDGANSDASETSKAQQRGPRRDFTALLADAQRLIGTDHIRHDALFQALQSTTPPLGAGRCSSKVCTSAFHAPAAVPVTAGFCYAKVCDSAAALLAAKSAMGSDVLTSSQECKLCCSTLNSVYKAWLTHLTRFRCIA